MEYTLLKNIGTILSGDIEEPIIHADSILIKDGKIEKVGNNLNVDDDVCQIIDVNGATVSPGLIDSHCHTAIGDWTPRQNALNWIDAYVKSGVTGLISAGEAHIPGRPRDAEGCKALAILAYKTSQNYRPAGMKVYGGAIILEPDATEEDIAECARIGMGHTGEIGLGKANSPKTAGPMANWARKHGMRVMSHTGGTFLAGSSPMNADCLLGINPDVLCHLSGSESVEGMKRLLEGTIAQVEICRVDFTCPKNNLALLDLLKDRNELNRLMLGNDAPSGMGVFPHGIWELICVLSSMGDVPPEVAIAFGTGNTARFYNLPVGIISPGYSADLVVIDAPVGCHANDALSSIKEGIIPAVNLVMIDGEIMAEGIDQVNSAPSKRNIKRCIKDQQH